MDFEKRLERAIQRDQQTRKEQGQAREQKSLSEDDLKTLHSKYRLELSEIIEDCLKKLSDHFPGFDYKTLVSEEGWGAKINRDDIKLVNRQSQSLYSRMEMVIKPFSSTHIVELVAKGTIRNKEILNRSHYQMLDQADMESFRELIDLWVLEYAESYAAGD